MRKLRARWIKEEDCDTRFFIGLQIFIEVLTYL